MDEMEPTGAAAATVATAPPAPVALEAPLRQEPDRRGLWLELGAVACLGMLPPLLRAISGLIWPSPIPGIPSPASSYAVVVSSTQVGVVLLYIMWRSGTPLKTFGLRRPDVWDLPLVLGVWAAVAGARFGVWHWLLRPVLPVTPAWLAPLPIAVPGLHPPGAVQWAILAACCLAVGFSEELVMRGYLIPRWQALRGSRFEAVLVSTGLFAACHIYQGFNGVAGAAVTGLVFGTAFCLLRRLWPLALAHAVLNFMVYVSRASG